MNIARTALVIGGNRFFGSRLVDLLLEQGVSVTVLNRGSRVDTRKCEFLKGDRTNKDQLLNLTKDRNWDIIFDQVCFDFKDSEIVKSVLLQKTKRYVLISSQSVYKPQANLLEADFDPENYQFTNEQILNADYAEGKRQLESSLSRFNTECSLVFIRLPIVLGVDDYTKRLHWHIDRIKNQEPIFFPNIDAKISFVDSEDAAINILKIGLGHHQGPINICSKDPIRLADLISLLQEQLKIRAKISKNDNKEHRSPFGIPSDWYMSTQLAQRLNFQCKPLGVWLPKLVASLSMP